MKTVKPDSERVRCGRLGGRPRRYDLSGFELGQTMTLEWRLDFRGQRCVSQEALHQAVRREERRLGQRFSRDPRPRGLVVTRVA